MKSLTLMRMPLDGWVLVPFGPCCPLPSNVFTFSLIVFLLKSNIDWFIYFFCQTKIIFTFTKQRGPNRTPEAPKRHTKAHREKQGVSNMRIPPCGSQFWPSTPPRGNLWDSFWRLWGLLWRSQCSQL